jgi:hypothetical protein
MKYFAISLLLVTISLANAAVILQFTENTYPFEDKEINIKDNPNVFHIIGEDLYGDNITEEFDFDREKLIQNLEGQHCLA